MILTQHGINSLQRKLKDFVVLTYFELDANGDIVMVKGQGFSKPSTVHSCALTTTPIGVINAISCSRITGRENFGDIMAAISGPVQVEFWFKNTSSGPWNLFTISVTNSALNKAINYSAHENSHMFEFSVHGTDSANKTKYAALTDNDWSYTSGGIFFRKTSCYNPNVNDTNWHYCVMTVLPDTHSVMYYLDGNPQVKLELTASNFAAYVSSFYALFVQNANYWKVAQFAIRKAVWTEPIPYELPSYPYVDG